MSEIKKGNKKHDKSRKKKETKNMINQEKKVT